MWEAFTQVGILVLFELNFGLGDKAFAGTDAAVFLWLTDENGKTMGGKNGMIYFKAILAEYSRLQNS